MGLERVGIGWGACVVERGRDETRVGPQRFGCGVRSRWLLIRGTSVPVDFGQSFAGESYCRERRRRDAGAAGGGAHFAVGVGWV
ncbi:unnamed protein product [Pieris brassicae]|uniref:Uncharacterized protein n=1 Tax=Pieris brassicae TaxID=7116 RepID=A0A9P0TU45_PIEBR|nr:unnamed protein product [Pieris brassicae]